MTIIGIANVKLVPVALGPLGREIVDLTDQASADGRDAERTGPARK